MLLPYDVVGIIKDPAALARWVDTMHLMGVILFVISIPVILFAFRYAWMEGKKTRC